MPRPAVLRLFLGALLLSGAVGCSRPEPAPRGVLRISQRNEPADLDPARATLPDEFFILRALGEGLVAPSPDGGTPQPAAASGWAVSTDGLTYTFHLRPDARWSNSSPVTADDFVASYERLLSPATAAPKAGLFFMVRGARDYATGRLQDFSAVGFQAPDPRTLVVTLERPMPRFLDYAASGPWIPVNPRVVARHGRLWTRPGHFVGNGPFTLVEWRPHQRIVVQRNPAYHDAARFHLAAIHFVAFDNGEVEERAFRAGQLDVTMAIPFSKVEAYRQERSAEAHRAPLAETRYLSFNTTRAPLSDVRVRRALSLALDRAKLVDKVLRGGQEPAGRLVPPALRDSADKEPVLGGASADDPAAARALLAAAGFPDGRGFPRLELSSWVGSAVCEAVQAMWKKELGIDVVLVNREAKDHLASLAAGRYDIAFMTAIPDVADAANLLGDFASGSPGNYPQWSDARYDALLAAAAAAPAGEQAARLLAAEARLLDQVPLAPLYFNSVNWLMRPGVRGWHQDPLWTRFYQDLSVDEPE